MNKGTFLFSLLVLLIACGRPTPSGKFIETSDVDRFWEAYDQIATTQDSSQQLQAFNELFWDRASPGQQAMFQARNYTPQEYLQAIREYPKFWKAVRPNTHQSKEVSGDLERGIQQLRSLYPELKPAKIYFTIGALRSNGTTVDSMILIGTELAFSNAETPADELSERLSHLGDFFQTEPGRNIVFLNVHEYVHTQQSSTIGYNLLAQTVLEGVAEFVAEKALGVDSPNPQIAYGRENDERVKAAYVKEMFSPSFSNWLWNSVDNEFGMRDLAYYIGYKICEGHYQNASDSRVAIKEMIELDYNNEADLIAFVEASGYFSEPLETYRQLFEEMRPTVVAVEPSAAYGQGISPGTKEMRILFSDKMATRHRQFEFGPLGAGHAIRIEKFNGFAQDARSVSFEIAPLEPNKKYQLQVGAGFRDAKGIPLVPYLIEWETTGPK